MSIRLDMVQNGTAWSALSTIEVATGSTCTVAEMPIYALGSQVPQIAGDAYIHPDAVIIGSVTVGSQSSVWPGAVLRGDEGEIRVGARTSVQDNSVLHTTPDLPTVVGDRCVVGHIVHLEGCTIHDDVLVGNGSIVLHEVVVHPWSIVGANSVVLNGTIVPTGSIAVGSPAVVKEGRARRELITEGVDAYVTRSQRFRDDLRRLD
jgi:carbonic anhydrase/acetyltransferase-like protein (isoleucine patch superfamily)